jgi:Domain of unknown function (DUF4111)
MSLPSEVDDVVTAYLREVDAAARGLVEGLYLTGSVALDDFRPGRGIARWGPSGANVSDIDFVAITTHTLDDDALATLGQIHTGLRTPRSRPSFDGLYVTWNDLARDPADVTGRPQTQGGHLDQNGSAHPVLWQEIADHAIAVRGPHRSTLPVRTDRDRLVAWVRGNLGGYWRRWHTATARALSPWGLVGLTHWGPTWGVLGVSRLHHTIRTGEICSKSAGGLHARERFGPGWHRIINECLRIRQGARHRPAYRTAVARRRDALAFVDMVIDDGLRQP